MPDQSGFRKGLIALYGKAEGEHLAAGVDTRLQGLLIYTPEQLGGALRSHIQKNIFPGVALYRCLLGRGLPAEKAIAAVEQLLHGKMASQAKMIGLLGWLPAPFAVFRHLIRLQMRFMYPPEGWEVAWRNDTPDCIDFDITRCIYLDMIHDMGHPELVPAFCRQDEMLGEAMAEYARFERHGTLALGSACCDFCYRKVG